MIKIKAQWKDSNDTILQFIDNNGVVEEVKLDVIVDKNNQTILKQIERWYANNNRNKEELELFLILNEYGKKGSKKKI